MATKQEFFNREHERLMRVETSIVNTRTEMEEARTQTLESLKAKRGQAAASAEARRNKIAEGVDLMQARIDAKKQESAATVEQWKHQREVHKLEGRAQGAEEYANAAMSVLELAQEEARAASLEAIEARREADAAKQSA